MEAYKSRVYTERPAYADYPAAQKFEAIKSIIARRLREHPKAICSYSGGSDSDIMIDLIEQVRKIYSLPPVDYCFFNTGLEMDATKRHVRETAQKYGVEIREYRPKKNIVQATREYGQPFVSKIMSQGLSGVQRKGIPLSIADEYANAEDKVAKRQELRERFPKSESEINFLCCCNSAGEPRPNIQLVINSSKYMLDFIRENPIPFPVSNKCCNICKKHVAHEVQKGYEMVITGERRAEGGMRSVPRKDNTTMCFAETADGSFRLRPLYYVTDADKTVMEKVFEDMPEEERIAEFWKCHENGVKYPARDLYDWHHRLTGSCEMGRNTFAAEHGIDLNSDTFTVAEFVELCGKSYGGEIIQKLAEVEE